MNFTPNRYNLCLTLIALLLGGCSSKEANEPKGFSSNQEAAVHFLKPMFPLMDCEVIGVISKGEVDEHFFQVFFALDRSRSISIRPDDLEQAFGDSSKEQLSYIFNLMDQNENGVVSTAEFRNFMYSVIDWADSSNDGEVTLADVGLEEPKIIRAHER